jgi:ABC-2 type transport system ATP-binding protein
MRDVMGLTIEKLCVHRGSRLIVDRVSLSLGGGQILGLVGPNGSGKSTLIQAITGLLAPTTGVVQIAGVDIAQQPLKAKAFLGYAPEPALLPAGLLVRQVLQLCAIARRNNSAAAVPEQTIAQATQLGMARYLDSFVSTLSLGTKQKLAVLIALMDAPPCIVLDEVFNGLDPKSSHQLKRILRDLRELGCAIVLATHGLELAADLLDQMVLLEEGKIKAAWDQAQFAHIQAQGSAGLEAALVAALD